MRNRIVNLNIKIHNLGFGGDAFDALCEILGHVEGEPMWALKLVDELESWLDSKYIKR